VNALFGVLLVAAVGQAASIRFEEFGPFSVRSSANGRISSDVKELRTDTLGELQVKYLAPAAHCSAVRMHFLLDGAERGASEAVSPGGASGYYDFGPVPAGEHVVGLRAEGLTGGCAMAAGSLHGAGMRSCVLPELVPTTGGTTISGSQGAMHLARLPVSALEPGECSWRPVACVPLESAMGLWR